MLLLTLLLAANTAVFVTDPCGTLAIADDSRADLHSFFTGAGALDVALRAGSGVAQQSATVEVVIASDTLQCVGVVGYVDQNLHEVVADTAVWNARGWEHRVLLAGDYEIVVLRILPPSGTEVSSPDLALIFKDETLLTILMM